MNGLEFGYLRAMARGILERSLRSASGSDAFEWTLQGFGFLRCYFGREFRLHVWDRRFAVPGASTVHDHLQWHFRSLIISGRVINYRFREPIPGERAEAFRFAEIQTGAGSHLKHAGAPIRLVRSLPEIYLPGQTYAQAADEVHESVPDDGTVTIIRRAHTSHGDIARVFWPEGGAWVSAEPRPATREEIVAIVGRALERFADEERAAA